MSPRDQRATAGIHEVELAQRIAQGDEQAFESLVRDHGARMLAVARRITGNDADAHDSLQEALLKCFRNMDQFQGRSSLGTWLHRITANAALMRLRTQKRGREDSLDELLPTFDSLGARLADAPLADTREIEALYEQGQTQEAIGAAIDRLPNEFRAIVIARDIEQLTTAETAKLLDISNSLVKTRLHRARAALKRLLDPIVDSGAI